MEFRVREKGNWWIHIGFMRGVALGFSISRWSIELDLVCFYIGLEF
jgi:hypothetical protein